VCWPGLPPFFLLLESPRTLMYLCLSIRTDSFCSSRSSRSPRPVSMGAPFVQLGRVPSSPASRRRLRPDLPSNYLVLPQPEKTSVRSSSGCLRKHQRTRRIFRSFHPRRRSPGRRSSRRALHARLRRTWRAPAACLLRAWSWRTAACVWAAARRLRWSSAGRSSQPACRAVRTDGCLGRRGPQGE
jgi:hypothetical protein